MRGSRLVVVGGVVLGMGAAPLLGGGAAERGLPAARVEVATSDAPGPAEAPAPPQEAPTDPALDELHRAIDGVLASVRWGRADWGILAISVDRGDTLYAREPDRALIPASNAKLFATAAALRYLGPDHRFWTWAVTDAPVRDGVVEGDLVLYGTGDPGLSDRYYDSDGAALDSIAREIVRAGVTRIRGRVLGDGTFFAGLDRHPDWDPRDLDDHFAAASSALSYAENVVTLRVEPGEPGLPPVVHTLPPHAGVDIHNQALTVAGTPRERLVIDRDGPTDPIVVRGELRRGGLSVWRRMTVQDPVVHAAHAFAAALERAGIVVEGGRPGRVSDPARSPVGGHPWTGVGLAQVRVLGTHRSPPLSEYVRVVNHESHNLFADLLLRAVGRAMEGEGSYDAGARAVERFLREEVGLAADQVTVSDGSGLAETNRASPAALVGLLRHAAAQPWWPEFFASLPEAGSRDLRRMRRTAAEGNLRAKTGTIRGVSSLSGIVRTAPGDRIAFAIVGNRLPSAWGAKRLEDRIGEILAEFDLAAQSATVEAQVGRPDRPGR